MKTACIVNPWQAPWYEVILYGRRFSPGVKGRVWREPLVTAQLLHQAGWEVEYLPFSEIRQNPVLEDPKIWDYFYDKIKKIESSILLITPVYNMASSCYNSSVKIAQAYKETHPDGKTIFTGFHVSSIPELCMQDDVIDVIALYDAPLIPSIILPLVSHLNSGESLKEVQGIYYREKGMVKFNPPACPITDHSTLPPPKYELVKPYFSKIAWNKFGGKLPLTLRTSYGCPNTCAYCYFNPREWRGMRMIPPENFRKELTYLFDHFDKDNIVFPMCGDELFISNTHHFEGIVQVMKDMDIFFEEAVLDSAITFTREKAEKVAQVSKGVFFGIETAFQTHLDSLKRKQDFSTYLKGLMNAQKAGLDIYISWLYGLPEDTPEYIAKNFLTAVELIRKGLMHYPIPCMLIPFPWTDIWRHPSAYGITIVDRNWDHYTEMCWYPVHYTRYLNRPQIWNSYCAMEMISRVFSPLAKKFSFQGTHDELAEDMEAILHHADGMHLKALFEEMGKIAQEEIQINDRLDSTNTHRSINSRDM